MSEDKTINIEDVSITVTCRECERDINFTMKKPQAQRICGYCGKGLFHIKVEGVGGKKARVRVKVEFEYADTSRVSIDPVVTIDSTPD